MTACERPYSGPYATAIQMTPCDRPAGHGGPHEHVAIKQRRRVSDEGRIRMGASALNIPVEAYRAQVARGLKWCSDGRHHQWVPREMFRARRDRPGGAALCFDCERTRAREGMRRRRAS